VWMVLAVAMAASAAVTLRIGRGTSFTIDEIRFFSGSANLDLKTALHPFNGHLVLVPRVAYAAIVNIFGPGYLPFRLLTVATILIMAVAFFVFAKRRIGPIAALAPTLVLLFFGSDPFHTLVGNGFTALLPVVAGLGALLALERRDLPGDLCASLLLCLGLATYTNGLPFVTGAAVLILIGSDRWRRAWVFLLPAALYAAWLLWSRSQAQSSGGSIHISNLLLAPNWAVNSLAAVGASLFGIRSMFGSPWGPVIAAGAATALAWRLSQGHIGRWLWAALALPATLWLIGAAAQLPPTRVPTSTRYLYPGAIAVLIVAVEAARGVRIQRRVMMILYGVAAIAVATNIADLRNSAPSFRNSTARLRSYLTADEIAAASVGPERSTELLPLSAVTGRLDDADYLDAVRQVGSPAFSLASLRTQSEANRDTVDRSLAGHLGLRLQPGSAPSTPCRSIREATGRAVTFRVPLGGVVLKASEATGPITLRRFGSVFTVQAGQLIPGEWMALSVPRDSAPDPWLATTIATPLLVCGQPQQ
jgi:hypothetical protein